VTKFTNLVAPKAGARLKLATSVEDYFKQKL
jgi:hypothetical protein